MRCCQDWSMVRQMRSVLCIRPAWENCSGERLFKSDWFTDPRRRWYHAWYVLVPVFDQLNCDLHRLTLILWYRDDAHKPFGYIHHWSLKDNPPESPSPPLMSHYLRRAADRDKSHQHHDAILAGRGWWITGGQLSSQVWWRTKNVGMPLQPWRVSSA